MNFQVIELIGLDSDYSAERIYVNGLVVSGRAIDIINDLCSRGASLKAHSVISPGHEKYFFQ